MDKPQTIDELLTRAEALAGLTVSELSERLQLVQPENLLREKGFVGQLLEACLGASAGSKALPDFPELDVELKTIPINEVGQPTESTFVCSCPLMDLHDKTWHNSVVLHKLKRVLWIPVTDHAGIALSERQIGMPLLWSPSREQADLLASDWQAITDLIALGRVDEISSHMGEALQLRPKAANSKALCKAIGPDGETIYSLPRGFYLRSKFTKTILNQHFIR